MIALIGKISRFILGDTVFAARFFPTLIGAASIILIGMMVRDMGGRKWAQFLACLGFLASPAFLAATPYFSRLVSISFFGW